jgi:hypothetical protein
LRARSLRAAGKEDAALQTENALFEKHGKRISLLHATRGRPAQALACREAFFRAANVPLGVEHIFAIDADDEVSLRELAHFRHVVVKDPRGCVKAWNEAAAASSGHVLVQLSDDWLPCYNWDDLVCEALGDVTAPKVLAIHDGHRTDALLCMAILTRARYLNQRDKELTVDAWKESEPYLFSPEYFGVYSDNEFTYRAYRDGVVIDGRKQIIFQHNHPCFEGKQFSEMDATYQRQNAAERYAEGKAIFVRRNPGAT